MTNRITSEFRTATTDGFICSFDPETGAARFESDKVVLIKLAHYGEWEFYKVTQRGQSKGLEMFVRHLAAADRHAVEMGLAVEMGRQVAPAIPSVIAAAVAGL